MIVQIRQNETKNKKIFDISVKNDYNSDIKNKSIYFHYRFTKGAIAHEVNGDRPESR